MLTTLIHRGTLKRNFYLASIICSVTYLMFYYRHVGLHDGFVYVQAGESIAKGENPYTSGITRSGTISSLLIYLLYFVMPKVIAAQLFQIINVLCVAWFIWAIKGKELGLENYLLALLISIWISPFRELLAINQVNCFVLGLLGTAFYIEFHWALSRTKIKTALIGLCFALAFDLKPHLLLVFIVVWAVCERSTVVIIWTAISFFALHVLVDLHVGSITEIAWFQRVALVEDSASTTNLGDSVTIWPIFQKVFPQWTEQVPTISLSLFSIFSCVAIYLAYKGKKSSAIILGLAAPALYIYFHFYDMIPIAIIFVISLIKVKVDFFTWGIFCLLLIPKEFTNTRNLVLILVLVLVLSNYNGISMSNIKKSLFGLLTYGLICVINSFLFGEPRLTQSVFVTELLILIVGLNLRNSLAGDFILLENSKKSRIEQ